jgi:hypothetical protein
VTAPAIINCRIRPGVPDNHDRIPPDSRSVSDLPVTAGTAVSPFGRPFGVAGCCPGAPG